MSVEAERAVLAGCMLREACARQAIEELSVSDFSERPNRLVFDAVVRVLDRGEVPDLTILIADLRAAKQLEAAGGPAFLAGLDLDLPDLHRFTQYLEAVKRAATRGRLVAAFRDCAGLAADPDTSVESVIQKSMGILKDEATALPGWQFTSIADDVSEALGEIDQPTRFAMPSGFPRLDEAMAGGVRQGELVLIAGRTSMGKTSFGLHLCESLAGGGQPTVMIELEMGRRELLDRVFASGAKVRLADIREKRLSRFDRGLVDKAARDFAALPIWFLDQTRAAPTLSSVLSIARRAKKGVDLRVLCVDSLNLLNDDTRKVREKREELGGIARALKIAAQELDIAILLLCQINREATHQGDKRPHLHHLAEADALAHHCDIAMFLHREAYYDKNVEDHTKAEVLMRKNRNGETGEFPVRFIGPYVRFEP